MDDSFCHDFFAHPIPTLHRRYEALRAVFLDHRPLTEIARQFGYRYGTLRNLVAQFRAQCRTGRTPPFSRPRLTDAPKEQHLITLLHNPIPRPRPIATNSF
ncbi:MAG TPA: helix-turn-helix domain-containing protein [Candidatus Methylomirabilis sp.]|jgi:Helix-turn-helix domain|nr:helix-turn-helix domain-containing protein [Candidatus Methylomirabilis sp.]